MNYLSDGLDFIFETNEKDDKCEVFDESNITRITFVKFKDPFGWMNNRSVGGIGV